MSVIQLPFNLHIPDPFLSSLSGKLLLKAVIIKKCNGVSLFFTLNWIVMSVKKSFVQIQFNLDEQN